MMNYHELLEKYFNAETSLEEEAALRAYMLSDEPDRDLRKYRPLFQFFEEEKEKGLSGDFDDKLRLHLEQPAKTLELKAWHRQWLKVAALVAVLVGTWLFFPEGSRKKPQAIDWNKYEVTEEQQAYKETVKALELLAGKLSKATQTTTKSMAKTRKVAKYLK